MGELLALIGFSFVTTVTPGPNNVLLWASGASFGFRRTVPHVVGTGLGVGLLAVAVAGGLGVVVAAVPEVAVVMRVIGSVYLVYLAYRIARSGALERGAVGRPLGLIEAAAFQLTNPKVWIFALGAITTFRPADVPIVGGSLLVTVTMMVVAIPTAAIWAAGGEVLGRLVADEGRRRIVSVVLAGLVAATVVTVWI